MSVSNMRRSALKAAGLTERQAETLEAIRVHIDRWGMPPSRSELGRVLGLKYHSSVAAHLRALARKGWVELIPSKDRGIRLLREGTPILNLDEVLTVAAGTPPMLAKEHGAPARMNNIESLWLRFEQSPDYLVIVEDDSMNQHWLKSGDMVAIRQNVDPQDGDLVIARIGPDITLKHYHRVDAHRIELQPKSTNPEHKTICVDQTSEDFEVVGIVIGAIILSRPYATHEVSATERVDG